MLEEAVDVIRLLWQGQASHQGVYYTVENARIYDVPTRCRRSTWQPVGPRAAELAGRSATA